MRAMSEAIEGAAAFTDFRDRLLGAEQRRQQVTMPAGVSLADGPPLGFDRQPGENRADHRARLKRERREARRAKVAP
jgi:hypothetical protein